MRTLFGVMLCLAICGCSSTPRQTLAQDMLESKKNYKTCLEHNRNDVSACDAQRQIYEADLKAYNSLFSTSHGHNAP